MFAFFDLDQTLLPYDTQELFCHHVLQQQPWRRWFLASFLPALPLAALRIIGETGLKRLFLNYLWRMPVTELTPLVETFVWETVQPLLYPEIVKELQAHQAAGLTTILTTASPDLYAPAIARLLKFDHCFSTKIDLVRKSRIPFTPRLIGPNNKGTAKVVAMQSLLPEGRPIPGSHAYSDSHADLPLLRLAEFPTAIHPTPRLASECATHGWRTLFPPRPFQTKTQQFRHTLRHVLGL